MSTKRKTNNLFFNRESSWIAFNHRVLEMALDPGIPVFERLKFIAIVSSNLDEFYMVRVGGLQTLVRRGKSAGDAAGLTPSRQLDDIAARVQQMVATQHRCYLDEIQPMLDAEGYRHCSIGELSDQQKDRLETFFDEELFPVLTPVAIVPGADRVPLIAGRRLHLSVRLGATGKVRSQRYAIIQLPQQGRFVSVLSAGGNRFVLIEEVVQRFIDRLFPGERVTECIPFRITRNADMAVQEDLASDLMEKMEQVIDERKRSEVIRLEYAAVASVAMRKFLTSTFAVDNRSVFAAEGPVDLSAFLALYTDEDDRLVFPHWTPQRPLWKKKNTTMFDALKRFDRLFYHPYDSFDPVVRFIEEAAEDPGVIAIKQVMYRNSRNSPLIEALIKAAERGKTVTVLMELKARFDEQRNIVSARELEDSGVQVIYGVHGLKTHAKICLVVRRESDGIQRYVHFGTGNYNEVTARLYTDVGYMTTNPDLCADASAFFNVVTGYSQSIQFRKIAMAPMGLRDRLVELIQSEIRRSREGQKSYIHAKMNSLVDPTLIRMLYEASKAGVTVTLNVRGICCLRPGVKGLSERIRVVSIVDRYLEHSRIFCFCAGGERSVFISSADWMPRNLDMRVELLVPIEDNACRAYLLRHLDLCFKDNVNAWVLQSDGRYIRETPAGKRAVRSQQAAYRMVAENAEARSRADRDRLVPHLPQIDKK